MFDGGIDLSTLVGEDGSVFQAVAEGMQMGHPETSVNLVLNIIPRPLKDGKDVSSQAFSLEPARIGGRLAVKFVPKPVTSRRAFVPRTDGDLDFGSGQVLPLAQLAQRVFEAFKVRVQVDPRIANDLVFLKGTFTKSRIVESIRQVGSSGPLLTVQSSTDDKGLNELKRNVISRFLSRLDGSDPMVSYLKQLLSNPGRVDPSMFQQYGYSPSVSSQATSGGLAIMFTLASNTPNGISPNGTPIHQSARMVLVSYGP